MSYGAGTAAGPAAIIAASQQLELYDDELQCEPYLGFGVATLRAPEIARPMEAALGQLAGIVEAVIEQEKFPLVLGGEHALTAGAIRPFAARHKDLVVLQLDAHADLRDGYLGEPLLACRRYAARPRPRGRVAGLGRHSGHLQGRGGVRRGQPRPDRHPLGPGPGALERGGDRRAAEGPAGLRDVRHRCAGCVRDAGDGHADAGRADASTRRWRSCGAAAKWATWSAPISSSWRPSRACTPATTPPPCSPTRCCPTLSKLPTLRWRRWRREARRLGQTKCRPNAFHVCRPQLSVGSSLTLDPTYALRVLRLLMLSHVAHHVEQCWR